MGSLRLVERRGWKVGSRGVYSTFPYSHATIGRCGLSDSQPLRSNGMCRGCRVLPAVSVAETGRTGVVSRAGRCESRFVCVAPHAPSRRCRRSHIRRLRWCVCCDCSFLAVAGGRSAAGPLGSAWRPRLHRGHGNHLLRTAPHVTGAILPTNHHLGFVIAAKCHPGGSKA